MSFLLLKSKSRSSRSATSYRGGKQYNRQTKQQQGNHGSSSIDNSRNPSIAMRSQQQPTSNNNYHASRRFTKMIEINAGDGQVQLQRPRQQQQRQQQQQQDQNRQVNIQRQQQHPQMTQHQRSVSQNQQPSQTNQQQNDIISMDDGKCNNES